MKRILMSIFVMSVLLASAATAARKDLPVGTVWYGTKTTLTFQELALYCAPVLWFSPDEPLFPLLGKRYVSIPQALPYDEPADSAVVYFRIVDILTTKDPEDVSFTMRSGGKSDYVLHLDRISQIELQFMFYYSDELGMGSHKHDMEMAEFTIFIDEKDGVYYVRVIQVLARAHGIIWYHNTLEIEEDAIFPMTLLVEEGKHATCTDRNGDGFYSPGYDVNKRVNDAWGVRDVIRSGKVFTANYNTWMTKYRDPVFRAVPPLPQDSPHYNNFINHYRLKDYNKFVYSVRPYPDWENVNFHQYENSKFLEHIIAGKGYPQWPIITENSEIEEIGRKLYDENWVRAISVAYRYDGVGRLAVYLPLLITRNIEAPAVSGWFVWATDVNIRAFSFNGKFERLSVKLLYTPSASRFVDWYLAAGGEYRKYRNEPGLPTEWKFVYETGTKFRFSVDKTPLSFMRRLGTDFWGVRFALRATSFPDVKELGYIVEVGAGVW